MKDTEKAKIILEELKKFVDIDVDENNEKWYLYGIRNGMDKIEIHKINKEKSLLCDNTKGNDGFGG